MSNSTIHWKKAVAEQPDSDTTVLVHHPDADEPTWLGYHDGEDWYYVDGMPAKVQRWAHLPEPEHD
ncbi:hypothetical protein [Methyloterricola oryzae]|uniref:hypothetical protein n=1 Tax=Methyloterricola oryzae TaxID=1495050 RepID=UPI0005EBCD99|nr:hypothetical protein [Methyloterricola oryzae]